MNIGLFGLEAEVLETKRLASLGQIDEVAEVVALHPDR